MTLDDRDISRIKEGLAELERAALKTYTSHSGASWYAEAFVGYTPPDKFVTVYAFLPPKARKYRVVFDIAPTTPNESVWRYQIKIDTITTPGNHAGWADSWFRRVRFYKHEEDPSVIDPFTGSKKMMAYIGWYGDKAPDTIKLSDLPWQYRYVAMVDWDADDLAALGIPIGKGVGMSLPEKQARYLRSRKLRKQLVHA